MTLRAADRVIARGRTRRTDRRAWRAADRTTRRTGDRQRRATRMAGKVDRNFTEFYRPKKFRAVKPVATQAPKLNSREGAKAEWFEVRLAFTFSDGGRCGLWAHLFIVVQSVDGRLALTPALSPEERESRRTASGRFVVRGWRAATHPVANRSEEAPRPGCRKTGVPYGAGTPPGCGGLGASDRGCRSRSAPGYSLASFRHAQYGTHPFHSQERRTFFQMAGDATHRLPYCGLGLNPVSVFEFKPASRGLPRCARLRARCARRRRA